jgi:hypothetical protein
MATSPHHHRFFYPPPSDGQRQDSGFDGDFSVLFSASAADAGMDAYRAAAGAAAPLGALFFQKGRHSYFTDVPEVLKR